MLRSNGEPHPRTVAVLGGGLAGVCAALELAEAGWEVDLIEREPELLSQASYWCEGKIHLGLTYTKDAPDRTARTMIRGALCFRPLLERWLPGRVIDDALSDPYDYAVPRSSMVPPAAIAAHFERVAEICAEEAARPGARYVAELEGQLFEELPPGRRTAAYDETEIVAAFATEERAVDTWSLAAALREVAGSAHRMTIRPSTTVLGVELVSEHEARVTVESGGERTSARYAAAVNALGPHRWAVDSAAGLAPAGPVLHRYKVALNASSSAPPGVPSVTFVTGEFGDVVSFRSRAYLSWYPAGLLLTTAELDPPSRIPVLDGDAYARVVRESLAGVARLAPAVADWGAAADDVWRVGGGYISALGTTGIDDPGSRLHERHEIGVSSLGPLHSVDTGKLTVAPLYAHEASARVLGSTAAL